MTESEFIAGLLDAAPITALIIMAGLIALTAIRATPGIQDKEIRRQEVLNEGRRIVASAEAAAHEAGNRMAELATKTMRDIVEEQRKFNAERVDSLLDRMRLLDSEIANFKVELKEKNGRIEELERENRKKDSRITELESEVDQLRKDLDKKASRSKKGDGHEPPKSHSAGIAPAGA